MLNLKIRNTIITCAVITSVCVSLVFADTKFDFAKEHFKKGFFYYNNMQYLAAAEYFRKAVSQYPEYYTAREYLAKSYRLSGFIEESINEWEALSQMSPDNVSVANKARLLNFYEGKGIADTQDQGAELEFVFSEEYVFSKLGKYRITNPVDIAVDKEKNIYITSFSSGKLVKLSSTGEGLAVLNLGSGNKFFGVACFGKTVCVSNFKKDEIYILNSDLEIIKKFGAPGNGAGQFHGPEGVCFDEKGNIYIADSGNHRIQKFDRNCEYIHEFGKFGEYEGQLNNPSYIKVYKDTVYITDAYNKRIACFDDSGNFLKNINIKDIELPRGIDINNNTIILTDEKTGLFFYDISGNNTLPYKAWDNSEKRIFKPVSVKIDRDGFLYCLDYTAESVSMFSPLKNKYANLDVEIASVDVKKYPAIAFYVNIKDSNGNPVYNLEKNNFKITEDSVEITHLNIDYLKDLDNSVSISLCVDRSDEAKEYHKEIPWVSDFILQKMKKNDVVKVTGFNKDIWAETNFDWSRRRTIKALQQKNYDKGKNFGKALYNSITDLLLKTNRRALVVITDGTVTPDSFRQFNEKNIIEYSRSHYIPVYFIVFKQKDPALEKIAKETGGGIFKANELDSLRSIYKRIKESEEYRYVLVYNTMKTLSLKDWWSEVKIDVKYKGLNGLEWGGYFVP